MNNEEIVLKRLENKAQGELHFKETINKDDYCTCSDCIYRYNEAVNLIKNMKTNLASKTTVKDRVYEIMLIGRKVITLNSRNRFQCKRGANRSAQDIWRIYRYYFGDIDIFSIMRALYQLSKVDRKLNGYRCPNVRKQVFWLVGNGGQLEDHKKADLGVALKDWKDIGIGYEEITKVS